MTSTIALCVITIHAWGLGGYHPQRVEGFVRSNVQCEHVADTYNGLGHAIAFDLPGDQRALMLECGPNFTDCKDWRDNEKRGTYRAHRRTG